MQITQCSRSAVRKVSNVASSMEEERSTPVMMAPMAPDCCWIEIAAVPVSAAGCVVVDNIASPLLFAPALTHIFYVLREIRSERRLSRRGRSQGDACALPIPTSVG